MSNPAPPGIRKLLRYLSDGVIGLTEDNARLRRENERLRRAVALLDALYRDAADPDTDLPTWIRDAIGPRGIYGTVEDLLRDLTRSTSDD